MTPKPRRFVSPSEFCQLAQEGRAGADVGVRTPAFMLRAGDEDSRVIRYCFSDGSIDRMNDTIDPNGWVLTGYRRNPVVLFSHSDRDPPIGRTVNVFSDGTRLIGDVEFADAETYEFADQIFRLVRGGYLRAGSVGFLPGQYKFSTDIDRPGGVDFTSGHELLEFSITPIPANENALAEARAKGLISRHSLRRFTDAPTAPGYRSAAPAATLTTLSFAGTFAQRRSQLAWHNANSPEAAAASPASSSASPPAVVVAAWLRSE
jgi:HK97 family phage prohead protease